MKPTLLVLAAGMGSRYGGLKQMDQFGPSGETIIDYSIYDAQLSGFEKVVFVIRRDMEEDFRKNLVAKYENKIDVHLVFQELSDVPADFRVPSGRKKPWGTTHAVWVAHKAVNEPFAIINADDFYGRGSYKLLYDFLNGKANESMEYCIIGYQLARTLSEYGSVSRGVCQTDERGYLQSIVERTKIYKTENGAEYEDENGNRHTIDGNAPVSMNMMGFMPSVFEYMEKYFVDFLKEKGNDPKAEYLLPDLIDRLIKNRIAKMKIIPTDENWFGVTYKEDKPIVIEKIRRLVDKGIYPEKLWDK